MGALVGADRGEDVAHSDRLGLSGLVGARDQLVEHLLRGAANRATGRRARRRLRAPAARPATISAAALFSSTMSRSGPCSPASSRASAGRCVPARRPRDRRAAPRGSPTSSGATSKIATLPSSSAATVVAPAVVSSSRPSPCTTQARSAPSRPSTSAIGLHPFRREHADELALRAGRVRQRPEQVEDRARAELDPGRRDVAGGAVMARRHQKADADLPQARAHDRQVGIDIDAERGQHVGRARFRRKRAVAVLGDRHAAAGDDQRRWRSRC